MKLPTHIVLTCEHGGHDVPDDVQTYFASPGAQRVLRTHRGFDPGALLAATQLAELFNTILISATVSRLVVELNRSLDSPELFSKYIPADNHRLRQSLLQRYYRPYRKQVLRQLDRCSQNCSVLHLSIHSFTPNFCGTRRDYDFGVLFDPARSLEKKFSLGLVRELLHCGYRALPNQPYLGTDDGLTTYLRTRFSPRNYLGVEIEFNNRFAKASRATQERWCQDLANSVQVQLGQRRK